MPVSLTSSITPFGVGVSAAVTVPLPGYGQQQGGPSPPAVYQLLVFAPGGPAPSAIYTFPISPQAISRQVNAMTTVYEVPGSSATLGVQRVIDQYGQSPPNYIIRGTTGFNYHSTDGFAYTGLQSIQLLANMIDQFFGFNAAQAQAGNPSLYTMEWADYFSGDFFQVVPSGPLEFTLANDRPRIYHYTLRLAGTLDVSAATPQPIDPMQQQIGSSSSATLNSTNTQISGLLTNTSATGPLNA